ncbi:AAA family ATPase [Synechococcus sp. CCY9201]|uniref:bifunctional DNA primase/polymerase n=1 Tax=Synechococcus sp. CCY9201 TaxID=174697 RepID=UPI002B20ECCC|nr:AAA family ATPase [Synechococcus sp. CCY9201]MEA5472971.1 AAA family ATPase [Synechococcus sp. CCY9201]
MTSNESPIEGNSDSSSDNTSDTDIFSASAVEQLRAKVYPDDWSFIPVAGKATYVKSWAQRRMTFDELMQEYDKDHRYRGLGVITGEASGGLIALDIDGLTAAARLKAAIGEENYEKRGRETTMAWTSGKRGRRQILWKVPAALVPQLRDFNTLILRETGDWEPGTGDKNRVKRVDDQPAYEEVVLRFNRCQSVLPGSPRPGSNYRRYRWLSYNEGRPADAPRWLIELLLPHCKPVTWLNSDDQKQLNETHGDTAVPPPQIRGWFFKEEVQALLRPKLRDLIYKHPVFDEYGWLDKEGGEAHWMSGCPWHKSESGTAFQVNKNSGVWYCHACAVGGDVLKFVHAAKTNDPYAENPTGPTLEGYVAEIAGKLGFTYPDDVLPTQRVANKVPTAQDLEGLYKECRKIDKATPNKEQARLLMWAHAQVSGFYLFKNGREIYDSYKRFYIGELTADIKVQTPEQLGAITETDYIIPDFLRCPSSVMFHARGGLGKTKLALALARKVGHGEPTRIRGADFAPTTTGKVLLLGNDMTPSGYVAYLKQQGIDIQGRDSHWMKAVWNWDVEQELELIDLLNELQPKLVIIDSLSSASNNAAHSENDKEYARTVYDMARFNGVQFPPTCFLWIHHNKKDGTTFRGTDVLRNAVDDTWELKELETEEQEAFPAGSKILQIGKSRGMRDGARFLVSENFEELLTFSDLTPLEERRQGTGDVTGPSLVLSLLKAASEPMTATEIKLGIDARVQGSGSGDGPVSRRTVQRWIKKWIEAKLIAEAGWREAERAGRKEPQYRWAGCDVASQTESQTISFLAQVFGGGGEGRPPESGNPLERDCVVNSVSAASASSESLPAQGVSETNNWRHGSSIPDGSEGSVVNYSEGESPSHGLGVGTGGLSAGLPKSSTSFGESGITAIPEKALELATSASELTTQGGETTSLEGENGIELIPNSQKLVDDFDGCRQLSEGEIPENPSAARGLAERELTTQTGLSPSTRARARAGARDEQEQEPEELDIEAILALEPCADEENVAAFSGLEPEACRPTPFPHREGLGMVA